MNSYVLSIISTALICCIIELLLSKETVVGQIARFLGRLLVVISLITPLKTISFQDLSEYLKTIQIDAAAYVENGKSNTYNQTTEIIKQKSEAYILDKANKMQCNINVDVKISEGDVPVPYQVEISGSISPYAKEVLSEFIEDSFGIAREMQQWS